MAANNNCKQTQNEYLEKHHLLVYFEDAISQLLKNRLERPKMGTAEFLHNYFKSTVQDQHVFRREYRFIDATPKNRSAFIKTFWLSYRNICQSNALMHIKEYHSLVALICPDFPMDVLQKTARIILMEDATECLISFLEFIYAFQLQVYYGEFINSLRLIFVGLHSGHARSTSAANSSSSVTSPNSVNSVLLQSVKCSLLLRTIKEVIYIKSKSTRLCCPPEACLEEILASTDEVTYFGLLMALTKCQSVNVSIGALPERSHLFVVSREENAR